jgi:hypothetical protein
MPITMLKCAAAAAMLLAPASAYAAYGDPARAESHVYGPRPALRAATPAFLRMVARERWDCGAGMRWQPFPTAHGYRYGCVPWR